MLRTSLNVCKFTQLTNKELVFESKQCEFSAYAPTHYAKLPLHANIMNILFHKVTKYVI